jgi:molybdopterin-containing oxidoreductase family membrane subunit
MATATLTEPTSSSSRMKALFWLLGFVCIAVGSIGWYNRLFRGHHDANYNNIVVWGLWVAAYIFFIGLSAGAFLISSLVYVFNFERFERIGRLAVFSALVTLFLALLSIWVDLGHMGRAWHVLIYPNFKSPMAWMIYLYTAYMVLLSWEMWFILRADLVAGAKEPGWRGRAYKILSLGSRNVSELTLHRDRRIVRALATLGVPLAVMFHGGVGALFATVAARPYWHSALFPILFILSALVSGGALLAILSTVFQEGLRANRQVVLDLGRLVRSLLWLDVIFQISEMLIAFRGGIPSHVAGFRLMLFGPYWPVFWFGQFLLGTVIPLVLFTAPTRKSPLAVSLACLLVVIGIFGLRLNIVIPGLAPEEIRGLTEAVSTPRITSEYYPSLSEWLLTIGIIGLGFVLFGIGEYLLPRQKKEPEHGA